MTTRQRKAALTFTTSLAVTGVLSVGIYFWLMGRAHPNQNLSVIVGVLALVSVGVSAFVAWMVSEPATAEEMDALRAALNDPDHLAKLDEDDPGSERPEE